LGKGAGDEIDRPVYKRAQDVLENLGKTGGGKNTRPSPLRRVEKGRLCRKGKSLFPTSKGGRSRLRHIFLDRAGDLVFRGNG